MVHRSHNGLDEWIFYPFLPYYLTGLGVLLGLGSICLWRAIHVANAWWCGVGLAGLAVLLLIARYNAQTVTICGYDLVIRTGTLSVRQCIFPIWQIDLELKQSLLGRLFDYATIKQHKAADVIIVHTIASAQALRILVAQQRQSVLRMLAEHGRTRNDPPWEALPASGWPPSTPRSLPSRRTKVF
jgi:hypothetical protein